MDSGLSSTGPLQRAATAQPTSPSYFAPWTATARPQLRGHRAQAPTHEMNYKQQQRGAEDGDDAHRHAGGGRALLELAEDENRHRLDAGWRQHDGGDELARG